MKLSYLKIMLVNWLKKVAVKHKGKRPSSEDYVLMLVFNNLLALPFLVIIAAVIAGALVWTAAAGGLPRAVAAVMLAFGFDWSEFWQFVSVFAGAQVIMGSVLIVIWINLFPTGLRQEQIDDIQDGLNEVIIMLNAADERAQSDQRPGDLTEFEQQVIGKLEWIHNDVRSTRKAVFSGNGDKRERQHAAR